MKVFLVDAWDMALDNCKGCIVYRALSRSMSKGLDVQRAALGNSHARLRGCAYLNFLGLLAIGDSGS